MKAILYFVRCAPEMILPTAKEIYRLNAGISCDFFSIEYVLIHGEKNMKWFHGMV